MRAVARPAMVEAAKLAVLTRAKARSLQDGAFRGFENPLPRTQVRGWHSSTKVRLAQEQVFPQPVKSCPDTKHEFFRSLQRRPCQRFRWKSNLPQWLKPSHLRGPIMYGLKPVPFKDCALLFLELWSTGFAVISVHQRGMEITVNRVCGQFRKSDAQDLRYFQPSPSTQLPRHAGAGRAGSAGLNPNRRF
jgi:hypothetical protein